MSLWATRRRKVAGLSVVTAATVVAGLVAYGVGTANATTHGTATRVTRAAIDPSLVSGRGATVDFQEQEAENAVTNGTVIGPDTRAYALAAEASGRSAVQLTPGQYVEFTLSAKTNAITVRYALPDAPNGGGITAPLDVTANGKKTQTMTLTSQYSWLYNQYPFSNDPNAGLLHPDWWITECQCVPNQQTPPFAPPTPFRPFHFYDEQRLMLSGTYQAGDTIRLTVPAGSPAAWTVIDLLDSQYVGPAFHTDSAVNVVDFGADPTGQRDSADAIDQAIAAAKSQHLPVYIPVGIFQVNRHIIVDDVTIVGAGDWYTIIKGHEVTLSQPAADGSVHTGVGFYGKYAADGGSHNVHLSGFAIEGDVRERIDTDQVNGIGGAMSDSTIDDLYIHHTKVGIWFDGPMDNVKVTNSMITDQIADGLNFHKGVTNSVVSNNVIRNTGDDALAMWSDAVPDTGNVFDHNTVQTPTLANGIAIYGGGDNTISNNLVADPLREGSALQVGSRFGATPFTGKLSITNNTTVRAGTYELNWRIGLGALWIYALQGTINADIEVVGDNFLDNTYNALMLVSDWGVKDLYTISNVHFKDIHDNNQYHPGTNWFTPYVPNTITCNDRPPVIAPPPPSAW
jgi:hypothetical protein